MAQVDIGAIERGQVWTDLDERSAQHFDKDGRTISSWAYNRKERSVRLEPRTVTVLAVLPEDGYVVVKSSPQGKVSVINAKEFKDTDTHNGRKLARGLVLR